MRLRRSKVVVRALWSTFALVTLAVGMLVIARPWAARAQSEGADPAAEEPAPEEGTEPTYSLPQRTKSPFEQYPEDADALRYEDLADTPAPEREDGLSDTPSDEEYRLYTNETKGSVDEIQAWVETHNNHATSQACSSLSHQRAARARLKEAEYEAGLAGMADLGVQ